MNELGIEKIIEDFISEKVVAVKPVLNRGSVNQIYVAETVKEKYILRVDPSENSIDRFTKEMWCSEVANKNGVFAPKVLKIGLEAGHPYMIMEYVDGINGDESFEKEKIWKILGGHARRIHSINVQGFGEGMPHPGVFNDTWSRYLDYNISSLAKNDKVIECGVITGRESEKIKGIFVGLKDANFKFGLTHYDLSLKNTILSKNGDLYVLDWGSALAAPVPYLDIAEILDSSLDEKSQEFSLFLDGYGLTYLQYEKLKSKMAQLNLLMYMDKLRWAIDRKQDKINYFSQKVRDKLAKV